MRHQYPLGTHVGEQLPEITITEIPCRHLNAQMMGRGILRRIEMGDVKRYAQRGTELLAEHLVTVRFLATQAEVAVGGLHIVAQQTSHPEQGHTVGPS